MQVALPESQFLDCKWLETKIKRGGLCGGKHQSRQVELKGYLCSIT